MANQTTITLYRYVLHYAPDSVCSDHYGDWNDDPRQTAATVAYGNAHRMNSDDGSYWTIETKAIPLILA